MIDTNRLYRKVGKIGKSFRGLIIIHTSYLNHIPFSSVSCLCQRDIQTDCEQLLEAILAETSKEKHRIF